MIPRIIITPGEPAGIGPDITIHIAQLALPAELVVLLILLCFKSEQNKLICLYNY